MEPASRAGLRGLVCGELLILGKSVIRSTHTVELRSGPPKVPKRISCGYWRHFYRRVAELQLFALVPPILSKGQIAGSRKYHDNSRGTRDALRRHSAAAFNGGRTVVKG